MGGKDKEEKKKADENTSFLHLPPQVVNVLRSLLTRLDEVKKEREVLEGEIKAVTFDMSTTFLKALAQDGAINEEQLSMSQLDQLYGSYNQKVQASLSMQEELLGQVQVHTQPQRLLFLGHGGLCCRGGVGVGG